MIPTVPSTKHVLAKRLLLSAVVLVIIGLQVAVVLGYFEPLRAQQQVSAPAFSSGPNQRPVIGVLTQPSGDFSGSSLRKRGSSYMGASYVKWLEAGGSRVVPIPYDAPQAQVDKLLASVNGILFMGGSVLTPEYFALAQRVYDYVLSENAAGRPLPLWGTCQGFEALLSIAASGPAPSTSGLAILTNVEGRNMTLDERPATFAGSRMFAALPDALKQSFPTFHNHELGILASEFRARPELSNKFRLIATNTDAQGREYVSAVEAFDAPVYAVQWHPEKPQYEWTTTLAIDHSPLTLQAGQFLAEFFVNEVRKSTASFPSEAQVAALLVENTSPLYIPNTKHFSQIYFFKQPNSTQPTPSPPSPTVLDPQGGGIM